MRRRIPRRIEQAWKLLHEGAPLEALKASRYLRAELAAWEGALADEARASGATWEEIGRELGVTRQTAWQLYRP